MEEKENEMKKEEEGFGEGENEEEKKFRFLVSDEGEHHRWKKLRKTGRCFPENIKSGRKFWGNMFMFSILTEDYSNTGKNLQK